MDPLSLSQIALESVVGYIENGTIENIDFRFDAKNSNKIFNYFWKTYKYCPEKLQLNLTRVRMEKGFLDRKTIKMLKNQKSLKSLTIGRMVEMESDYKSENGIFQIQCLLEDILSEESRKTMKHLDLPCQHDYRSGWTDFIGKLLPNLEHLLLIKIKLETFPLCLSLLNLKTLDLGCTSLTNLHGLSNLKNLEALCVRSLELKTPEDMMELFECQKLRMLELSKTDRNKGPNVIEVYLECGKVLEELRFLDCNGTDINQQKLEKLQKSHKKLRQVVVLDSILDSSINPDIELLNCATPQGTLKCLQHYIQVGREGYIGWMISTTCLYLRGWNPKDNVETLQGFLMSFCEAINTFYCNKGICESALKGLTIILREQNFPYLTPKNISTVIDRVLESGNRWLKNSTLPNTYSLIWKILRLEKIQKFPFLPVKRVCLYAAKCLVHHRWPIDSQEFSMFFNLKLRLNQNNFDSVYRTPGICKYMISILGSIHGRSNIDMIQFRDKIGLCLDIIYENTWKNDKGAEFLVQFRYKMNHGAFLWKHSIQILLELCRNQWSSWGPEKVRVLVIVSNLSRVLDEKSWKYLVSQMPFLIKNLEGPLNLMCSKTGKYLNTDRALCSLAILTALMSSDHLKKSHKNPNIFKKAHKKMKKIYMEIKPDHISVNLKLSALYDLTGFFFDIQISFGE